MEQGFLSCLSLVSSVFFSDAYIHRCAHFERTRSKMHIRTNLYYESDCILSACVCAYDRIAVHTHIHIQMLIGGRLSIAIRLLIHFSFSLFNMTATYRPQLPLLIITYVIFSSLTRVVNAIEYGKQSLSYH